MRLGSLLRLLRKHPGRGAAGGGPPTFDGNQLIEPFSAYTPTTGLPAGYVALEESTPEFTFEVLAFDDARNTDPLGGQVLRCAPPAAGATGWLLVQHEELDGEAASGEILALIRHPPSGFDSNRPSIHPAICVNQNTGTPGSSLALSFGIKSTFFTNGYRNMSAEYYSNSSLPRAALGDWIWIRLQRNGTSVKARWWLEGDAEPGTWRFDGTPTIPAGDGAGFFLNLVSSTANGIGYDISYWAFTNNFTTAPLSVPAEK